MDQREPSQPVPSWHDYVLSDAEYESVLSQARDFTAPGEPGFVEALDSLRPGPLLQAVLEENVSDLSRHSHAEVAAVVRASDRLITYARYVELMMIGELARRRLVALVDAA